MANDLTAKPDNSIASVIERMATSKDVDVSKLEKFLDMQERIMNKNAEMAFNSSMTRLQKILPIIHQGSQIKHGDKLIAKYANYEQIDKVIRPLYSAEGFSLSFNSKRMDDGTVVYYGTVAHEQGYSRTAEIVLPSDTGPGRNAVQAQGSSISYAKRYLVTMLLNLVTTGEDDDGNASGAKTVTQEMVDAMEAKITATAANRESFLAHFKVTDIMDMPVKDYTRAMAMLKAKGVAK